MSCSTHSAVAGAVVGDKQARVKPIRAVSHCIVSRLDEGTLDACIRTVHSTYQSESPRTVPFPYHK
jgi:hypothetical protein